MLIKLVYTSLVQRDGAHGAAIVDDHLEGRTRLLDGDHGGRQGRGGEVAAVVAVVVATGIVVTVAVAIALTRLLLATGLLAEVVGGGLVDDAARSDHVAVFDRLASVEVVLTADDVQAMLVVVTTVARLEAVGIAADTVARALDAAVVQLDDFLRHFIFSGKCFSDKTSSSKSQLSFSQVSAVTEQKGRAAV